MLKKIMCLLLAVALIPSAGILADDKAASAPLYDFESNAGSFKSWEDKSRVSGGVYKVESYSYLEDLSGQRNYRVDFEAEAESGELHNPAIYLRADDKMNGYRFEFDLLNEEILLTKSGGKVLAKAQYQIKSGKNAFFAEANGDVISFGTGKEMLISVTDRNSEEEGFFAADCGDGKLVLDNVSYTIIENAEDEYYRNNPSEDYKKGNHAKAAQKAMALGFMTSYEDGSFKPFEIVTRGELAGIIARMSGINVSSCSAQISDMKKSDEFYADAAFCTNNGYIRTKDGSFLPDEAADFDDAIRALTLLSGRRLLDGADDESKNYYTIAERAKITSGIEKEEFLTRDTMAQLVVNTAECELMTIGSIGAQIEYEKAEGITLLSEYHDIRLLEGIVVQNSRSGLYSQEGMKDGYVMIEEYEVETMGSDIGEYLGMYVECYGRKNSNGSYSLVWFDTDERNKAIKVDAEEISEETTAEKFVYQSGKRTVSVDLSKNIIFIYNGVADAPKAELMKPELGSVTLLYDKGKLYAVSVQSFKTMFSGSVSYYTYEIQDKYFDTDRLVLDDSSCSYIIYSDGKEIPITQLYYNRVLTVAESHGEKKHYTIYVSAARVEGKFTGETDDTYTIGDIEYKNLSYGDRLYESMIIQKPNLGTDVTAYLDYFGNIAFMESMTSGENFGYLLKISKRSGISNSYEALIYKADGEWLEGQLSDKLKVNGETVGNLLSDTIYKNGEAVQQLIYFNSTKNNKITNIDTALPENFGSVPLAKGTEFKNVKYASANTSLDSMIYLDYRTLVISVPSDTSKKSEFLSGKRGYLIDGNTYKAACYNVNEYDVAEVVVIFETEDIVLPKLARLFVVDKTVEKLGDDGDTFMAIYGYRQGKSVVLKVRDGMESKFVNLKTGDSVLMAENGRGEAMGYTVCHLANDEERGTNNPDASQSADRVIVSGTVTRLDMTERRLRLDLGSSEKAYYFGNANAVYIYYSDRDILTTGSVTAVDLNDYVVCNFCWNKLNDIVIYK